MKDRDKLFWVWLAQALKPANAYTGQLLSLYENPYDLFEADEAELEQLHDIPERLRISLCNKSLQEASDILDTCERRGITVLHYADAEYPRFLRGLNDPPIVLYCIGKIPDWNTSLCVAMVGTRKMSAYGLHSAYRIAYKATKMGMLVVSGMATGIDGVCSAAALAAGGEAVAVLGCGVDVVYPKHHGNLYDAICKNGVVISEYPPGTGPRGFRFPERNRIISGLSQATVVLEAGLGSGSLITAKDAIMQGRDVYALPANVGSEGAEGTNGLLRDGATPITSAEDLLERYRHVYEKTLRVDETFPKDEDIAVDLHLLQELGVIELTERAKAQSNTPNAAAVNLETQRQLNPNKAEVRRVTKKKRESGKGAKKDDAPNTAASSQASSADALFSSLDPISQTVLRAIPDDTAVSLDDLRSLEYPYGDIVSALTILEINGLLQKLPGALYVKL